MRGRKANMEIKKLCVRLITAMWNSSFYAYLFSKYEFNTYLFSRHTQKVKGYSLLIPLTDRNGVILNVHLDITPNLWLSRSLS